MVVLKNSVSSMQYIFDLCRSSCLKLRRRVLLLPFGTSTFLQIL